MKWWLVRVIPSSRSRPRKLSKRRRESGIPASFRDRPSIQRRARPSIQPGAVRTMPRKRATFSSGWSSRNATPPSPLAKNSSITATSSGVSRIPWKSRGASPGRSSATSGTKRVHSV